MPETALEKIYEILKSTGLSDDDVNRLLFDYLLEQLIGITRKN